MLTPFRNITDEIEFLAKGFFKFPLLNEHELKFVLDIYNKVNSENRLHEKQFYGVNYSLGALSAEENNLAMTPILHLLNTVLERVFADFSVLGCVFITKPPHTNETFVLHQDWSYTDEQNHTFVTCWIPLCDTDPQNGGMSIIEESHKFFETYRSNTINSARIPFEAIPDELRTSINQKAGNCLSFHQAVFHGSYPNHSHQSRPVLAFVVKHKESPITHYTVEDNTFIEYNMTLNSFNQMLMQIPNCCIPTDAQKTRAIPISKLVPTASLIIEKYREYSKNHRLIRQEALHREFIKNGFVILKDAIRSEQIALLKQLYQNHFETPSGMYVSHHDVKDMEQNLHFSNEIFRLTRDFMTEHFFGFQPLIAHFAAKGRGKEGIFNLHQDWSIVEESLYAVAHCWIPLQNVSNENGTLTVLPSTHLCFNNYRSGTCPIRFLPIDEFENEVVHINARVGDVVIYHPALFHGSGANMNADDRIAVVAAVAHPSASRVYYHKSGNIIYKHALTNEDLFSRLDDLAKGEAPMGAKISSVAYSVLDSSIDTIKEDINRFLKDKTLINANL